MKKFLLVALLSFSLKADAIISGFANVRSATIGASHCNLYLKSPSATAIQMACWDGPSLTTNFIKYTLTSKWSDTYQDENGEVTWIVSPSADPTKSFDYQVSGSVPGQASENMQKGSY